MNDYTSFMTEEQKHIHAEYFRLHNLQLECKSKMDKIREDFCKTLPIKEGDFITVGNIYPQSGWVKRMIMDESLIFLHIYLNRPNIDGTPSGRETRAMVNISRGDMNHVKIEKNAEHQNHT